MVDRLDKEGTGQVLMRDFQKAIGINLSIPVFYLRWVE
jgi:hypothetical protein